MERRLGKVSERLGRAEEGRPNLRPTSERAAEALRILSARKEQVRNVEGQRAPLVHQQHSVADKDQSRDRPVVTETSSEGNRCRSFSEVVIGGLQRAVPHQEYIHVNEGDGIWKQVKGKRHRKERSSPRVGTMEEAYCQNCRRKGHWKRECKEPARCYNCQGFGHIAKYCKVKTSPKEE